MSFNVFLACVLVMVYSAFAILERDQKVPDEWGSNLRDNRGFFQYVRDATNCSFGYICDMSGKVLDVYDCSKFNAFFSITFKICATESVLKAYQEETCDFIPKPLEFKPQKDDALCDQFPNGANVFPDDCSLFVLCWDNASLDLLKCLEGTGFESELQRCENIGGSRRDEVCGNRPVPKGWIPDQNLE